MWKGNDRSGGATQCLNYYLILLDGFLVYTG